MIGLMTDPEQVRRLLALYCQLLDDRRYNEWSQLFAADGVWALGGREYRGPAEVRAYMEQLIRDRPRWRTKHLCTNIAMELDGPHGSVTSDYALCARDGDVPWSVANFGRYEDRIVRRADGAGWQFAQRRLTVA
jgi:3-phenylpropionate/cinnamic acid dioxygenase small subunit